MHQSNSFFSYDETSEDDKPIPSRAISTSQLGKDIRNADWRKKYFSLQQQYDLLQKTNTDLRNSVNILNKELKETREAAEQAQDKNRTTLDRLKTKFSVLEETVVAKHKTVSIELEHHNNKLQMEIVKLTSEVERLKDVDSLIVHYRTAISKLKNQISVMKSNVENLNVEKQMAVQEMSVLKNLANSLENKNRTIETELEQLQKEKRKILEETEAIKKKHLKQITELEASNNLNAQKDIDQLKSQTEVLEETVKHQKEIIHQLNATINKQREDYNINLQAALELATDSSPETKLSDSIKFTTSKRAVVKKEKFSPVVNAESFDTAELQSKQPTKMLKKDLELLDAEIAELDKELAKATEKLNIV